jgi:hypothetical protein
MAIAAGELVESGEGLSPLARHGLDVDARGHLVKAGTVSAVKERVGVAPPGFGESGQREERAYKEGLKEGSKSARPARSSSSSSRPRGQASSSRTRSLPARAAAAVPGRIPRAQALPTKLITALFMGAFVLEVVSYATGNYFSFDWKRLGEHPLRPQPKPSTPLYSGEAAPRLIDYYGLAHSAEAAGSGLANVAGGQAGTAGSALHNWFDQLGWQADHNSVDSAGRPVTHGSLP